jgi:hypothetical protein
VADRRNPAYTLGFLIVRLGVQYLCEDFHHCSSHGWVVRVEVSF